MIRVFYRDDSPASREAEAILDHAGLDYQSIFVPNAQLEDKVVPQLLAREGVFPSVDLIRWYTKAFGKAGKGRP